MTTKDGIQSKLKKGIGIISLQKSPGKDRGLGGQFSEHLSSLYLSIDFERLTVIKAKEWHHKNPNNKMYGFTIVEGRTRFHNICPIKRCLKCYGTGKSRGQTCDDCSDSGYKDS